RDSGVGGELGRRRLELRQRGGGILERHLLDLVEQGGDGFFGRFVLGHDRAHWLTPLARKPPSTAIVSPLTKLAASDDRKMAAPTSSSSWPKRFIGVRRRYSFPRG